MTNLPQEEICPVCGSLAEEIIASGYVGCANCYRLRAVRDYVNKMYGGKKHKKSRGK